MNVPCGVGADGVLAMGDVLECTVMQAPVPPRVNTTRAATAERSDTGHRRDARREAQRPVLLSAPPLP